MRFFHSVRFFGLLLMLISPMLIMAQFYNGSHMNFGKSRVQWDDRIWFFYRFDQFDTYHYQNGKELALYTARYAEAQIPLLERRLQTALNEKIQFVIFNSLGDLKQSNIGLASDQQYNTGGITHIVGSKVVVYFDGNYLHFEQQIRAGIAEILISQLMFGGSVGAQIRNTTLFKLPDWYMKGLLSYVSEDWNTGLDSRVSEGVLNGRYRKINRLEGEDARIAGHSMWRFIEKTYGPGSIPDIIHMTQASRNVQNGFLIVTGIRFKQLMKDWDQFYATVYSGQEVKLPQGSLPLKYRTYRSFNRPDYSPDGRYLSYTTSDEGLIMLWLLDLQTGKRRRMYKAGYSTDEKIDESFPLTAWHPSGEIFAFVLEEKGRINLYLYNLEDKTVDFRNLIEFQKVTSISYSGDGRRLAMSAVRAGKPDIYIFDLASNSYVQITNDYYTDKNPVFAEGNKLIVFSSNRPSDTLFVQDKPEFQLPTFDLFAYNLLTGSKVLRRLTDSPLSNETNPSVALRGGIHFLCDASGFYNLFKGRFDSVIAYVDTTVHYRYFMESVQLTTFTTNILHYTNAPLSDEYIVAARDDNRQKLFKINEDAFSARTKEQLSTTAFMQEKQLMRDKTLREEASVAATRKRFRSLFRPAILTDTLLEPLPARQGAFGISGSQRLSLLNQGREAQTEDIFKEPKRRSYFTEYFYDELVTQVDFTYLNQSYQAFAGGRSPVFLNPGFNVFMGVNLTDLMEDYRISAGVRLNTTLTNNEYALSFSNLKRRLDKTVVLHRQSVENIDEFAYTRTHSHQAYYMMSWPFSEILSAKGTAIYRNDMKVFLATDQINLKKPNEFANWGGLRGELVFDNSRQIGTNLLTGTRWKLFGEYYQLVDLNSQNFVVLGFDWRNYQRVHRNFIWANRLAGSTSFGNNKLIYYMGGVDNWLLPRFDRETPIDYGQNYAYQTLATNMRGFNQNIRNGNSFVVANTELRFPVFSYLLQNPISSDFIRNFQIVAFGDLGTAWTGWNPYDPGNSLYTSYINSGPLNISVEVQKDPLVGGLGFGARTTLLGYFIRGDLAWGIEDARIKKPVLYLSFSLDF